MAFNARTRKYLVVFLILGWSITLIYTFLRTNPLKPLLITKPHYRDNRLLMEVSGKQNKGQISLEHAQ